MNNNTVQLGEQSRAQATHNVITRYITASPISDRPLPASYATYRMMRKDPTIALARALSAAPIVAAEWSVEADDDAPAEAVDLITKLFLPIREPLVERSLLGGIDFGHQPFEKVFAERDGYLQITKFKPLLHDINEILVDKGTGAFIGFRNGEGQGSVTIPLDKCLLLYFRVEGTNWAGEALLENDRETWNQWLDCNKGAVRYDRMVAGSRYVIRHPDGESVDPISGQRLPNWQVADNLLAKLESVLPVVMPDQVTGYTEALNRGDQKWQIEILEDSTGRQPTFIERLRYLDSLKCRGMLIPERSILEGQYGTKAEAGEQIDLALTHADLTHRHVTRLINWYAVDQVLGLNWGEAMRGRVRLQAAPIRDAKLAHLKDVYQAILTNPGGFLEEFGTLDTDAMKDALGLPKADTVAQAGEPLGGVAPLAGVDAADVRAATVRQVYSGLEGAAPAAPTTPPAEAPAVDATDAAQKGTVQATALTGVQITSLLDICAQVASGAITREAAREIMAMSFPLASAEQIDRLLASLKVGAAGAVPALPSGQKGGA